jgi:very-short-patch-repair endonuclease
VRPPLDGKVAALAARQWGVVSSAQLRALGMTGREVGHRMSRGRMHRVYRGVYAVGHRRLAPEGRFLAAVLACGTDAVLSHRSAAHWWGLLAAAGSLVDVTSPHGCHAIEGIRRHRSRCLIAGDTTNHHGIPITSVSRTLLDLAATITPDRLERALAQAERLQRYDHTAILDVIQRTNGHRGRTPLARATAREPKLTRSEAEARFLQLAREAAVSEPLTNFTLTAPDHPRLEVDFYWPTHRLIVEIDGWETHRTRAAFEADRRRDAALQAAGHRVLRFTWRAISNDGEMVKRRLTAAAPR